MTRRSLRSGDTSSNATSPARCSFYISNLGNSVLAQLLSGMLRHHGAPGTRSSQHSWRPPSHKDTDTLFTPAPRLRAQLVQLQTTPSPQMTKPAFLLKPTWLGPSSKGQTKTSTSSFLKASLPHLLTSLCSSPNPHHTPKPTSCNPAVKHTRLRTAVCVSL